MDESSLGESSEEAKVSFGRLSLTLNCVKVADRIIEEPRKVWVKLMATGDLVEISLDRDKPPRFSLVLFGSPWYSFLGSPWYSFLGVSWCSLVLVAPCYLLGALWC